MSAPTKAQTRFLERIGDCAWHQFNGRVERMAWRLEQSGHVELTYEKAAPGMPTRINVRIKMRQITRDELNAQIP